MTCGSIVTTSFVIVRSSFLPPNASLHHHLRQIPVIPDRQHPQDKTDHRARSHHHPPRNIQPQPNHHNQRSSQRGRRIHIALQHSRHAVQKNIPNRSATHACHCSHQHREQGIDPELH